MAKKYDSLGLRPGMATPAQLRLIEVLWAQVSRAGTAAERAAALNAFLSNRFHRSHIEMVERSLVQKIVKTLNTMIQQHKQEIANAAP